MSSQLPEGFSLNYNIPSSPTGELLKEAKGLPEGFKLNYNLPSDNVVPKVAKVKPEEVNDPVVTSEGVTVGSYISSKTNELVDAVSEDYDESVAEAVKALEAQGITGAEKALRVAGASANFALDVIGETFIAGLSTVGDGVSFLIPDTIEEPVKQKFKNGVEFALNSEVGQAGIAAVLEGQEAWEDFKKAYPRAAENLEAVGNIALLVAPVKGGKVKPDIDVESKLSKEARKQAKIGAKQTTQTRRQDIVGTFTDLGSPDVIKRTTDGIVRLNPMERNAADALASTKGFKKKRSATYNTNVINKEATQLRSQLAKMAVNASGRADLPQFYSTLTQQFDGLVSKSLEPERTSKELSRVMEAVENAIAKKSNSAKGLLDARQELDNWFKKVKGEDGFNKQGDIPDAVRIARNAINSSFDELVPEAQALRKKHSGLLFAQEGMADMASKEGGVFSRTLGNIMKVTSANRDVALALAGLTGGAVTYGASAGPLALAAVAGFGSYAIGKPLLKYGLDKAKSRKNLAIVLKGVDNAIKAAKGSPQMVKQLRADRALLVSLVTDLEEIWESGGKEAFVADQKAGAGIEPKPLKRDPETGELIIEITK